MKYNPNNHHRRSIRLKGYDYTRAGAYFVTICTYRRGHIFGEVRGGKMILNARGRIARDEWFRTAALRPYVDLDEDEFVVMPNHIHGIIRVHDSVGGVHAANVGTERRSVPTPVPTPAPAPARPNVPPKSLGAVVRAYKSAVTYAINALENARGAAVWQGNYYEHIIRNEREWDAIRRYILANPVNWQLDRDNIDNVRNLPSPEMSDEYLKDVDELNKTGI